MASKSKVAKKKPGNKKSAMKKPAAKKPAKARKGAPAAAAAKKPSPAAPVKVGAKGVLIRLKKPAEKSETAAAETGANRSFTERSTGSSPITLHHRKLTKPELVELREALQARRKQLLGDVKGLEQEAFSDETQIVSTNHLADSSFEQYEQEFNLSMIENGTDELKEIARALDKMTQGNFGACESCGVDISVERLRAMPYTRVCMRCRTRFEEEGNGREFGVVPERRV